MGWILGLFRRNHYRNQLHELADRVASRCFESVWQGVQSAIVPMGTAEARGYVRARASLAVQRELEAALRQSPRYQPDETTLLVLAIDAVWNRVALYRRAGGERRAVRRAA